MKNGLTNDEKALQIFESFSIDHSLPKYKKANNNTFTMTIGGSGNFNNSVGWGTGVAEAQDMSTLIAIGNGKKKSKVSLMFAELFSKPKGKKKEQAKIPIQLFFYHIKNSTEELAKLDERIKGYQNLLEHLKDSNQTAMVEQAKDGLAIVSSESKLFAINLPKYVKEEAMVDFLKKTEEGIRIDWIKNFTRVIPANLLEIKKKCDEQEIFDNYVIVHYDPKGKFSKLTKKEIEKKKDPIIFGVLEHSRKLYYIGDWVDEYCDLTLEKLADHFAYSDHKINTITPTVTIEDTKLEEVTIEKDAKK